MKGYVGLLTIGGGEGLVLGDMPMATAWWPLATSGGGSEDVAGLLVRWMYANSEEDVLRALRREPNITWADGGLTLRVGTAPLYLFDAAVAGEVLLRGEPLIEAENTIGAVAKRDYLTLRLATGDYGVETAEYQPDAHTMLILHRLTRK